MSGLPCTWTIRCANPALFHVMGPEETLAELPTVCSRHLTQAVATVAVMHGVVEVRVRVHATGDIALGSASLLP